MYDNTLSELTNHQADIRAQQKWALRLVIADGHFNLTQHFVWADISYRTHFIIRG